MTYETSQYLKYIACGVTSYQELIDRLEEVADEMASMEKDGVAACFCDADEGYLDFATDDPAIAAKYNMLEAEEDEEECEELEELEDDIDASDDGKDPFDLGSIAKTAWDIVYGRGNPFQDRCRHCGQEL